MLHGPQQSSVAAALIFTYLLKTPGCPVGSCAVLPVLALCVMRMQKCTLSGIQHSLNCSCRQGPLTTIRGHRLLLLQVLSLLDNVTASSLLKLVQAQTAPKAPVKRKKENAEPEDMEVDADNHVAPSKGPTHTGSMALGDCATVISNLADLFQYFGIRDQPDIVRSTIETLAQVTRLCTAGVILQSLPLAQSWLCSPCSETKLHWLLLPEGTACCMHSSAGTCTARSKLCTADGIVQACFKALMALLHTRHGSVRELSAMVLRQMTASILGLAESAGNAATKAGSSGHNPKHIAAVRSQALQFAQDVAR